MFLSLLPTLLLACAGGPDGDKADSGSDAADSGGDSAADSGGDSAADSGDTASYDTYACGWEKRDPGTLVSTGTGEGDVLGDLTLVDQCGESFRVWDMYGEYFILFVTAAW